MPKVDQLARPHAGSILPSISPSTLYFFRFIVRSYFRRSFRSVMVQGSEHLRTLQGPAIIYANHSSWWDPMICILLASELLPGRPHFAPIDASALKQYPILRRVGLFPVETHSPRGAAQFLRTSTAILRAGGVVWVTPQGRFADPREQPLAFRPGLGALCARMPLVPVLPLAIEYTFWNERLPEALVRFAPLQSTPLDGDTVILTDTLENNLRSTMEELKAASLRRDASAFETLLAGRRGTGGVYSLGRRLRALLTGRAFQPDHTQR